ncbi:hypothetical protein [Hoeflea sp. TYP-13]|uniref:hypothetical protein n=1 Tax=Hoeflea sp. TYP-13 TaxID=3230023 RepID=UPI0034C60AAB
MFSAEREYTTARSLLGFVELIAWVVAVLGLILALVGFASGGVFGMMSSGFGSRSHVPFLARLVSAIPGMIIAYGGFAGVAWAQVQRATVDTASMTRMILELTRRSAATNRHNSTTSPISGQAKPPTKKSQSSSADWASDKRKNSGRPADALVEEEYKGVEIYKTNHGNYVGEQWFPNIDRARKFIDGQSDKSGQ